MARILAYGAYLPMRRLERREIARAHGRGGGRGERLVAAHDEDSLTMAAEALQNCLAMAGVQAVDRLYFATTTPPYAEKSAAALLAAVADLPGGVATADFGGSLRAGAAALRAAADAVDAGSARTVAVVVADVREAEPGSDLEPLLGAGAAAFLVGGAGGFASIGSWHEVAQNLHDTWRPSTSRWVASNDPALARTAGLEPAVQAALRGSIIAAGLDPGQVSRLVLPVPDGRIPDRALKALGLAEKPVVTGPADLGYTGCAAPFLGLIAALETAQPGERLFVLAYGDGAAGWQVSVDAPPALPGVRILARYVERRFPLRDYVQYLRLIGVIESSPPEMFTSGAMLHREEGQTLRLHASRCGRCEAVQYPTRRVCWQCGAQDEFEPIVLSRTGRIHTFTREHLYPAPESPTVMAVIDLDGGGRFFCQVCDCDPAGVAIGGRVELVLRLLHRTRGINHYFWKARPLAEPREVMA